MKRIERFVFGDVELCIFGRNAERFFLLCASNGIRIHHLIRTGPDEYICHMTKRNVWDSRPYYRKTGVHCRINHKRGLPFLLFRYRKRILFPLALCVVLYLMGYCSQFIWRIEVNGNSSVTEERLISYLKENNASYGTKISTIDCDALELMLREDFDEIIWTSVAIEGTNLIIELQEKTQSIIADSGSNDTEEVLDYNTEAYAPFNDESEDTDDSLLYAADQTMYSYAIVADKDATITSIVTRRGLAAVAAGDEVSSGDVLVEGTQEVLDDDGSTKFWYIAIPDADIIGTVTYEYTDSISSSMTVKSYGSKVLSRIYIQLPAGRFTINLPFNTDESIEILENYYQARLTKQFYLPFGIGLQHSITVLEETVMRTDEDAYELAESNLEKYLQGLEEDGVVILSKTVTMHKKGDEYVVEGEITALEMIGTVVRMVGEDE